MTSTSSPVRFSHSTTGLRKRQMIGDVTARAVAHKTFGKNSFFFPSCWLSGCCPPTSTSSTPRNPSSSVLYCSAVATEESSDSESEESSSVDPQTTTSLAVTASTASSSSSTKWKDKLLGYSNFASFLCILDCTILPALTVLLPLFGILTAATTTTSPVGMLHHHDHLHHHYLEWLHELGHMAALYFVMPVGFLATTTNYLYNHRKIWITLIGWMGLGCIFIANAGCSILGHSNSLPWLHRVLHVVAHGVAHRVTNLTGCALLITSNLLSRRWHNHTKGCSHGPDCGHNHHD